MDPIHSFRNISLRNLSMAVGCALISGAVSLIVTIGVVLAAIALIGEVATWFARGAF